MQRKDHRDSISANSETAARLLTIQSVWLGNWIYGPSLVDGDSWVVVLPKDMPNSASEQPKKWTIYTPVQADATLPSKMSIIVDQPKENQTIQPGEAILVSGSVYRTIKEPNIIVSLYESSSGRLQSDDVLIAKQPISMSGNTFSGYFHVPKAPFTGSAGGKFILKFDYPESNITYSVPLAIAETRTQ